MKWITGLLVAAAVVAVPATALAKSIKQEGAIVGDDAATITLKVKTEDKEPIGVRNFRAMNVASRCEGQASRIDFTVLGTVNLKDTGRFKVRLSDDAGGILRVTGKVENDGRRVVGNLKARNFESSNGLVCRTPKQRFTTAK